MLLSNIYIIGYTVCRPLQGWPQL